MSVIETFGKNIESLSGTDTEKCQKLLKVGWQAQNLKLKMFPDKKLLPADRYMSRLMMNTMLAPLKHPDNSVIVSIFTPCEIIHEAGLYPYNVEAFSSYLAGSMAEQEFLHYAESEGIAETLCSYHKVFIGAADKGILPKPKFIVYTNLVCDANLLTFRRLSERFNVPSFFIDVPFQQNNESVCYVAEQLRELTSFIEKHTAKKIDNEKLSMRLRCAKRTLDNYAEYQKMRAEKYVPTDLVSPMYAAMTNNILLGTESEEKYTQILLENLNTSPSAKGKRIYWMHTIPFWSDTIKEHLSLNEKAQIVGCELAQVFDMNFNPDKPYEAMAKRLVYHAMNGGASSRIENGIRHARETKADGVIWFNHWGCKSTLGTAQLAKKRFEEQGIPLLILDGDGCNRSHGGEGQTSTRIGAFLEMLGGDSYK